MISSQNIRSKVLDGNNVGKGSYPFHAAVIHKSGRATMENFTRPFCGGFFSIFIHFVIQLYTCYQEKNNQIFLGSIISNNFVLSAAHCFVGNDGSVKSEMEIQVFFAKK